jgi:hypothetical protein
LVFFAQRYLYPLTIFLVPFSATAVANIGASDSASGVPAGLVVGALWMAVEFRNYRGALASPHSQQLRAPRYQLIAFLMIVLLSLIMPIWSNGSIQIESSILTEPGSTPLRLTFKHITQSIYVLYGVLLAIALGFKNSDLKVFMRSSRIFLLSAVFVSLWGLFQLSCSWFGVTYPAYIFNTSATPSALGYSELVDTLGIQRISSVATEPSIFATCMLVALVFGLFASVSRKPIISKVWDRAAVCIITVALLLSTSTTAYIGLVMVLFVYIAALTYVGILGKRHVVKLCLFAALLWLAYVVYPPVQDVVNVVIVNKGTGYSALEGLNGYILARDYFLAHPLLGLGWGSVTSRDLVLKLLSNTGVLGFAAFFVFLLNALVRLWRVARVDTIDNAPMRWCAMCLLSAYVVMIFLNLTTGFEFAYGQLWFVLGLAIAVPAMTPHPKPHECLIHPIQAKEPVTS